MVKNAYTEDSIWRNRDTFIKGQDEIVEFLSKKWAKENGYRLRKELFAFRDNKACLLTSKKIEMLTGPIRSQCSSGMNSMMNLVNGGDAMVSKIGHLRKTDG